MSCKPTYFSLSHDLRKITLKNKHQTSNFDFPLNSNSATKLLKHHNYITELFTLCSTELKSLRHMSPPPLCLSTKASRFHAGAGARKLQSPTYTHTHTHIATCCYVHTLKIFYNDTVFYTGIALKFNYR